MQLNRLRSALARTYDNVDSHHTFQMSAALSYFFVMSIFPALITLSAIVTYLPVPDLFGQGIKLMSRFVPADSMGIVEKVLHDVISPNRSTFLSLGILGTVWAASGGLSATMEALNVAYDVRESRPFWQTRPLAIGLSFLIGALLLTALGVMTVGPRLGDWLISQLQLPSVFAFIWPYLHWGIAVSFAVLAVEALYFFAPDVKQRFAATLPGAILAVAVWLSLTYLLGIYFRSFASLNKTYGSLGAAIALMVWLNWTGFAMLVGAELNSELAKDVKTEVRAGTEQHPPSCQSLAGSSTD